MTLQDAYTAIHEGAAIGAVSARVALVVSGADRATYLQGLLTNDIVALAPGDGCYALWLTPQGRMLTDMHVLVSDTLVLLDVPAESAQATLDRLEQFIFTEDVQVASLAGGLTSVWVHGPRASEAIEQVVDGAAGLSGWAQYRHARFDAAGGVSVARVDELGVPGYCLHLPPGAAADLVTSLEGAGAVEATAEALAASRVEAGYPVFGLDLTEEIIPLEAGIEQRAISFTKGCYVGQEVIIRVLHRGQGRVARRLVRLHVDGEPPARGAKVFAGEREAGFVTTSATSPASGAIALAYVHRDLASQGAGVLVETSSGRTAATVSVLSGA